MISSGSAVNPLGPVRAPNRRVLTLPLAAGVFALAVAALVWSVIAGVHHSDGVLACVPGLVAAAAVVTLAGLVRGRARLRLALAWVPLAAGLLVAAAGVAHNVQAYGWWHDEAFSAVEERGGASRATRLPDGTLSHTSFETDWLTGTVTAREEEANGRITRYRGPLLRRTEGIVLLP